MFEHRQKVGQFDHAAGMINLEGDDAVRDVRAARRAQGQRARACLLHFFQLGDVGDRLRRPKGFAIAFGNALA